MHLPDGFIHAGAAAGLFGAAAGFLAAAWSKVGATLAKRIPALTPALAGNAGGSISVPRWRLSRQAEQLVMLTSLVFVAQMFNFPVATDMSGHLLGAALLAIACGPAAAVIGMGAVIILQAVLLGDGGLVVLGANLINMAVIAPLVAHLLYSRLRPLGGLPGWAAVAVAAWFSVMAAAVSVALELAVSGVLPVDQALSAMAGSHVIIGLAEAAITILLLRLLTEKKPVSSNEQTNNYDSAE